MIPAPVPMHEAIRIVNDNVGEITGTLRAIGSVDGRFTDSDGRSHSYHVDGVLFYLAPTYVRLDLKSFGDRQLLLGSNADRYWFYAKDQGYQCGRHRVEDELGATMPIRPDQVIDALGLTRVPCTAPRAVEEGGSSTAGDPRGLNSAARDVRSGGVECVQRIVEKHQQILFLERDRAGNVRLEKEYWLDRYWPRLIRRVVFRDGDGAVEMRSNLDDYRTLGRDGPLLPRVMAAEWPKNESSMRFRVSRWSLVEQIGPDAIQFATPSECPQP
jgi:hypothetical protein